jgi:hypothetical protein
LARTTELENLIDIIQRQGLPTIRGGGVIGTFLTLLFVLAALVKIAQFLGGLG